MFFSLQVPPHQTVFPCFSPPCKKKKETNTGRHFFLSSFLSPPDQTFFPVLFLADGTSFSPPKAGHSSFSDSFFHAFTFPAKKRREKDGRHFLSAQRKTYHFFLCHHKRGAGSVARLLKILLLRRSQAFTSFVDCDDLQEREIARKRKRRTSTCLELMFFFL